MQPSSVDERPSLILTRIFAVAPEKVWRAWTDPDALRIWWNQADSPGRIGELDVRAGGRYRVVIKAARNGRRHGIAIQAGADLRSALARWLARRLQAARAAFAANLLDRRNAWLTLTDSLCQCRRRNCRPTAA
jgi:hypothetical protein